MAQCDLALRQRRHLWVVGNHHDGVALLVEVLQQFGDDGLVGGVEIAGGFIREENRRIVDQSAGDADALLFAARELTGQMADAVAETDFFECGTGLGSRRSSSESTAQASRFQPRRDKG